MPGRSDPSPYPLPQGEGETSCGMILVANKVDLGGVPPAGAVAVSALTGEGLSALRDRLAVAARSLTEGSGPPPLTQARHRAALLEAQHVLR